MQPQHATRLGGEGRNFEFKFQNLHLKVSSLPLKFFSFKKINNGPFDISNTFRKMTLGLLVFY